MELSFFPFLFFSILFPLLGLQGEVSQSDPQEPAPGLAGRGTAHTRLYPKQEVRCGVLRLVDTGTWSVSARDPP